MFSCVFLPDPRLAICQSGTWIALQFPDEQFQESAVRKVVRFRYPDIFSCGHVNSPVPLDKRAAAVLFAAYTVNQRIEGDIDRSYQRLGFWAMLLGIIYGPSETPYERAEKMTAAVPKGRLPIRNLTHEDVRKQFSADHAGDSGFDPRSEWRTLRPVLLRQSLSKRLQRRKNDENKEA